MKNVLHFELESKVHDASTSAGKAIIDMQKARSLNTVLQTPIV